MRHTDGHKTRITAIKRHFLAKGLAVIFFFFLIIRLAIFLGSDSLAEGVMIRLMENDNVTRGILDFELGGAINFSLSSDFSAMFSPSPDDFPEDFADSDNTTTVIADTSPELDTDLIGVGLYYVAEAISTEDESEIYRPGRDFSISADQIVLTNTTSLPIDVEELLNKPLDITLTHGEPAVLILHTHTSEAFTPSDGKTYIPSDPYRTEDQTRNITRVGDELAAELERHGIGVIHDRRSYDFPSFAGSYSRAYRSIRYYLEKYPSIRIVFDVHRDSITGPDGSQLRTIAQIDDVTSSQIMLVVGTNYAGLNHPLWRENMSFALKLQNEMNVLFPSLARPVFVSEFRFNQQATTGSLIIEVGSAGNSLTESLIAVGYFAEAAANVILSLYE